MDDRDEFVDKLKGIFDLDLPPGSPEPYPKEAMSLGTYVRSIKLDRLGVITDAFYGDRDKNGIEIIVYTLLILPSRSDFRFRDLDSQKYYLINEYEYDVIGYLMKRPVDIKSLDQPVTGIY